MENSIQLAKFMQKNICSATGRQDKGVHQDNLAVLRLTSMPACLMELGFISTQDEEQYMNRKPKNRRMLLILRRNPKTPRSKTKRKRLTLRLPSRQRPYSRFSC